MLRRSTVKDAKVVRIECMKNSSLDRDSTKECINDRLLSHYSQKNSASCLIWKFSIIEAQSDLTSIEVALV